MRHGIAENAPSLQRHFVLSREAVLLTASVSFVLGSGLVQLEPPITSGVDFGHQEDCGSPIRNGPSQSPFAFAVVVLPGVIQGS